MIRIKIARVEKRKSNRKKKYDVEKLQEKNTKNQFTLEGSNRFESLKHNDEETIDELNDKIHDIFEKASEEILGFRNENKKTWITNDTWLKVLQRKPMKGKVNSARTRAETLNRAREYAELHREVRRDSMRDKRQ